MFGCSQAVNETVEIVVKNEVGEQIDGPANVRTSVNGDLLFELNDGVVVHAGIEKNKWLKIGVFVKVNNREKEDFFIDAESLLYNTRGDIIGKTYQNIPIYMINEQEMVAYIEGTSHMNNVKPESLIENQLISYLQRGKRSLQDFGDFIKNHQLEEENSFLDYKGYFVYENMTIDPSPGFRVLLLFKNEELKGVFHSRTLDLNDCSTYHLMDDYKVSFFNDYPTEKHEEFVLFMKEWLQGVD